VHKPADSRYDRGTAGGQVTSKRVILYPLITLISKNVTFCVGPAHWTDL